MHSAGAGSTRSTCVCGQRKGGFLMTGIERSKTYQRQNAGPGNIALLRARAVAGDAGSARASKPAAARAVHAVHRDSCARTCGDASAHASELSESGAGQFDISRMQRHRRRRFLVQYWVLENAGAHPES